MFRQPRSLFACLLALPLLAAPARADLLPDKLKIVCRAGCSCSADRRRWAAGPSLSAWTCTGANMLSGPWLHAYNMRRPPGPITPSGRPARGIRLVRPAPGPRPAVRIGTSSLSGRVEGSIRRAWIPAGNRSGRERSVTLSTGGCSSRARGNSPRTPAVAAGKPLGAVSAGAASSKTDARSSSATYPQLSKRCKTGMAWALDASTFSAWIQI